MQNMPFTNTTFTNLYSQSGVYPSNVLSNSLTAVPMPTATLQTMPFNNAFMNLVPNWLGQMGSPYPQNYYLNNTAGAEYVNPDDPLESLSGLPYTGFLFGGTLDPDRNAAVDAAIAAGNLQNYQGSEGNGRGEFSNVVGDVLGSTVGATGQTLSELISNIPFIGRNIDLPLIGPVSVFNPILNLPFGQVPMSDEQVRRNAIYNFGPRADAFEARGDSYGVGVAAGLRGTQVSTPEEQKIPVWDDLMTGINNTLGFISGMNLPVLSHGADLLRSMARGARGDATYDWIDGTSRDPMDPTWTVFGSPVNLGVSLLASRLAPVLGLDQEAMDQRLGRAVGDAMNVYDVFLPGDHTLHAWGSFFPRAITGSSQVMTGDGTGAHGHTHQHQVI